MKEEIAKKLFLIGQVYLYNIVHHDFVVDFIQKEGSKVINKSRRQGGNTPK